MVDVTIETTKKTLPNRQAPFSSLLIHKVVSKIKTSMLETVENNTMSILAFNYNEVALTNIMIIQVY